MSTFLLTWNPKTSKIDDYEHYQKQIIKKGSSSINWSTNSYKKMQTGDRVFFLKQGPENPKGIFASGILTGLPYQDRHWRADLRKQRKKAWYVKVKLNAWQPLEQERLISRAELDAISPEVKWNTQGSGISIPNEVAEKLEKVWSKRTKKEMVPLVPSTGNISAWENYLVEYKFYSRGRSSSLRKQAFDLAKGICQVCETDFNKVLGGKGLSVLQVHHKNQLSDTDLPQLTKLNDLAVVCANCHALVHCDPGQPVAIHILRRQLQKR